MNYHLIIKTTLISILLQLGTAAARYFAKVKQHDKMVDINYFSKGHLFPSGDAGYSEYRRKATFFYINAAPQWQSVNGGDGNWEVVKV